jgi:hypothetical protein
MGRGTFPEAGTSALHLYSPGMHISCTAAFCVVVPNIFIIMIAAVIHHMQKAGSVFLDRTESAG